MEFILLLTTGRCLLSPSSCIKCNLWQPANRIHLKSIWHYSLYLWLSSLVNLSNLISHSNAGVEGMECSLPMDGRRVSLTQLSKDSFRECQATLTLTDLFIIIFSGISVSVVAIMTSFFLASTVHWFQRWSKGTKGDEEEIEEWEGLTFLKASHGSAPGKNYENTMGFYSTADFVLHIDISSIVEWDIVEIGQCPSEKNNFIDSNFGYESL